MKEGFVSDVDDTASLEGLTKQSSMVFSETLDGIKAQIRDIVSAFKRVSYDLKDQGSKVKETFDFNRF